MSKGPDLVNYNPGEYLEFVRKDGNFVPSKITLENTQEMTVVFKVKTTQPQKYLVKPNQGCILPGETATVVINIHQREWNASDKGSSGDKFKVETAQYPDHDLKAGKEMTERDLVSIFKSEGTSKYPVSSRKLKCKFIEEASRVSPHSQKSSEPLQSKDVNTPTKIFDEFKDLRKKYDKLVEYTVKLTGERDDLLTRVNDESNKNQMLAAKVGKLGASEGKAAAVGAEAPVGVGGISFFYALLIALVCFLLGRVIN